MSNIEQEIADAERYRLRNRIPRIELFKRIALGLVCAFFGLYCPLSLLFFYNFWFPNGEFVNPPGWFPDPPKSNDYLILLYWLKRESCFIISGMFFLSCLKFYSLWKAIKWFVSTRVLIAMLVLIAIATYFRLF